jgi:hypothetical protein
MRGVVGCRVWMVKAWKRTDPGADFMDVRATPRTAGMPAPLSNGRKEQSGPPF